MPNYAKLRDMVGHRVTFDFDTGARVVGYLAACKPAQGPVQVAVLSRCDILDTAGQVLEHHAEFSLVPNLMTGFRVTEGPGGF
jgi:hypothetical protein